MSKICSKHNPVLCIVSLLWKLFFEQVQFPDIGANIAYVFAKNG